VLAALCRPAFNSDVFSEPASVRQIAEALVVTEAAIKQHLMHLYDKFAIGETGERRRVGLAREALRLGLVAPAPGELASVPPTSPADGRLRVGDDEFARRDWETAVEWLSAADSAQSRGAADLEPLAESALWTDGHEESLAAHERAYEQHLRDGNPRRAAFVALMLVIHYAVRLELAAADDWFGRARRLLEDEAKGPAHG